MRAHAGWIAAALAAVVIATWPTIPSMTTAAVGHPYGDLADHYWGTWWVGHELGQGRLPLTTDLSHRPDELALWYVDPVGAALALPGRVFGFPAAWNLLVLLQLGLATLAGYAIGWAATKDRAAALVAAVVAGPSPYALGLVHSGLSEYLGLAPVYLYVWAALTALEAPGDARGWRRWAPAVWLGLSGWQAGYYLAFGVLFAAAMVPGAGWAARAREAGRFVGAGVLLALPVVGAGVLFVGEGGAVTAANAPGWTARLPATDLLTFVRPGPYYFPDTPANGNPGILHVNYLGWVALALAGWGVFRARETGEKAAPSLKRALGYVVLALGPRLALGQKIVMVGGMSVLLPLGLLYFPGSPLGMIHQPYRMVALLVPVLAVAAARGAAALPWAARPVVAALILGETLLVSPAPWPLEERAMDVPEVYAHLGELQPAGEGAAGEGAAGEDAAGEGAALAVLDWPPDASTANRDYLVWATAHGRPIAYGVNVFLPATLRKDPLVDRLLRALDRPEDRARNRDVPHSGPLLLRAKGTHTRLRELGFGWVVVHHARLSARESGRLRSLLETELGPPGYQDPEASAWVIP